MENPQSPLDYKATAMHLLYLAEMTLSESEREGKAQKDVPALLCREVALCTHGRMHLLLTEREDLKTMAPASQAEGLKRYVQYGRKIYGTLVMTLSQAEPVTRQKALEGAHMVAKVCGWILYVFELSFLISSLSQLPNPLNVASLTAREREVLKWMCLGYNTNEIAELLSIEASTAEKHKRQVCNKLGARHEQEALIIAYRTGLFSPLDGRDPSE